MFVAEVCGHIDEGYVNECIDFPLILRNIDVVNSASFAGTFMFEHMQKSFYPINKKEKKLCTLLSTHGEFMPFASYYLWFLIDYCHFVVGGVRSLVLFSKHDSFNKFVTTIHNEGKMAKSDAKQKFCKLVMNGSSGFESLNCERFTKTRFCNSAKTITSHQSTIFPVNSAEGLFGVEVDPKVVYPKVPIQSAVFTLDNAKFWILNFIYRYLYKTLDRDKFMIMYTDTDSLYIAVADSETADGLMEMTNWIQTGKELLKFHIEFISDNFLAVGPKSYTCYN
ncbi:hypothetical protein FACS189472_10100 [Alphaproteobacteria bacterium]|nr:hypothetical protein FACS189472_10100 [Alphaproteobacteria bacterium]